MESKTLTSDDLDQLVVKMKKGDRKATAALYDDLAPKLYGFIYARTSSRDNAQDLSQEIFVKLIEHIKSFDPKKGKFTVWFWRMARNTLIDHYRQKKPMPFSQFDDSEVENMAIGEIPDTDNVMAHRKLKELIETFTPEEKDLFELRFVAEMPYKDIAKMLDKSEGTLRVSALRLKEKIQKEFK
jgi:RNA polymerase sigma-70 factor (ECF subfamily)